MLTHHTSYGPLQVTVPPGCSVQVGDVAATCRAPHPLLDAALQAGFELVAPVTMEHVGAPLRSVPDDADDIEAGHARLTFTPAENQTAVVLLNRNGVYTWHFPDRFGGQAADSPVDSPVDLHFQLALPAPQRTADAIAGGGALSLAAPLPEAAPVPEAAPAQAWLLGIPRVPMAGLTVGALEAATIRTGLRRIKPGVPMLWRPLRCYFPPRRRAARVLLFFHGTFSTTLTSFGSLGATRHGKKFLGRLDDEYDLVVGYDHRSLSTDPTVNAADALARLQRLRFPQRPVIDVVGFSRGGLVARTFVEEAVPASDWAGAVRKVVLVAAPNDGSPMADPQHWKDLIDRHTTLAVAAAERLPDRVSRALVTDIVNGVGVLAKLLAAQTPTVEEVPGLAAMTPNSPFLQRLNGYRPGEPTPGHPPMYVVGADFEPQANLASPLSLPLYPLLWMLDRGADKTLPGPNDLMVAVSSTGAIDVPAGTLSPLVTDRLELPASDGVYHFTYFESETAIRRIGDWLA